MSTSTLSNLYALLAMSPCHARDLTVGGQVPFVLPGDLAQTVYTRAVWSMVWHRCYRCERRRQDARRQMLVAYDWLLPTSTCALGDIAARCPNQTDHVLDYTHGPFYTFYMPEL